MLSVSLEIKITKMKYPNHKKKLKNYNAMCKIF